MYIILSYERVRLILFNIYFKLNKHKMCAHSLATGIYRYYIFSHNSKATSTFWSTRLCHPFGSTSGQ